MLKNRILVAMFASAFFVACAGAGWTAVQIMMEAGLTPGGLTMMFAGLMFGSVWPDLFSKSLLKSTTAGWMCLGSYLSFLLSAAFSCLEIYKNI